MPVCVHALHAYTWEYFVPHFIYSLQIWSDWDPFQTVIQKSLSVGQQQNQSWQKYFLGTYCLLLDEIFSQNIWTRTIAGRPLDTIVGDREKCAALL